ncbi:MAG TPA: endonuclease [Bacteroidaceae bacterium]|nr:endonuclease [Bacteroidaceae bacterium]
MIKKIIWSCLILYGTALITFSATAQQHRVRILWWNVENLFDCEDDSLAMDDEFLPHASKHWTKHRYYKKLWQIGKVLSSMGDTIPSLVGLAEVEGEDPLRDLIRYTLINLAPYKYICTHGHDKRGIQVAMLYDPRYFSILDVKEVSVSHETMLTRDYLHATGVMSSKDTLEVYLCHWPSQWGGARASEYKRLFVSKCFQRDISATIQKHPNRNVLVLGDYNEESKAPALKQLINKCHLVDCVTRCTKKKTDIGTHYYNGRWSVLDHILVSQDLMNRIDQGGIWRTSYLLEKDARGCTRPNRTYIGPCYHGGYSDHLPVYLDIVYQY